MAADPKQLEFAAEAWLEYRNNPARFCAEVLEQPNDPWQDRVLEHLAPSHPSKLIYVASGHGPGKTNLAAKAVLWAGSTWGSVRIPCTAPKEATLLDKLWPEIRKIRSRAPILHGFSRWAKTMVEFNADSPPDAHRWFAKAETARDPEGLAGHHEDRVLFIVEEATGVGDEFWPVIMGALSTPGSKLLAITNPTRTSGGFASAFRRPTLDTKLFRVSWNPKGVEGVEPKDIGRPYPERAAQGAEVEAWYSDRPGDDWARGIIDTEGWDSDICRIRVRGMEPTSDEHSLVPAKMIWDAWGREPAEDITLAPVVWTWDVAGAGRDRSVQASRKGPLVQHINFTGQDNLHFAAQELAEAIDGEQPDRVNIDVIGIGHGPVDELAGEGYYVDPVNVALPAEGCDENGEELKEQYANRRAWFYWRLRNDFRNGNICLSKDIPEDKIESLAQELEATEWRHTPTGKIQIVPKDQIKKTLGRSPDVADALMLFYEGDYGGGEAVAGIGETEASRADW